MWAFKASWLALVTWHPGMGHFCRCRDALDVPAPAKPSTLCCRIKENRAVGILFPVLKSVRPPLLLLPVVLGSLPPPSTSSSLSSYRPALLLSGDVSCAARRSRSRMLSCTALSNLKLNSCSSSSSLARTCSASISASLWILCCSSLLNLSFFTASTCSLSKFM